MRAPSDRHNTALEYFNYSHAHPENSTWNDRWIIEAVYPGKTDGYFIEAGAGAGMIGSCTYAMAQLGWKGMLVEPIDKRFEKCVERRPESHCINLCLSADGEPIKFLEFPDRTGLSTAYDFRGKWHDRHMENLDHNIIEKQSIKLEDALDQAGAPAFIEYMALDINGPEFAVLQVFPFFDKYTVGAISCEGAACNELLTGLGYVQVQNPFTTVKFENYFLLPDIAENYKG